MTRIMTINRTASAHRGLRPQRGRQDDGGRAGWLRHRACRCGGRSPRPPARGARAKWTAATTTSGARTSSARPIDDGRMLEYAVVFGRDFYGTPRSEVDPYRAQGVGRDSGDRRAGGRPGPRAVPGTTCRCSSTRRASRNWKRGCAAGRTCRRIGSAGGWRPPATELARADEFDHVIVNDDLAEPSANWKRLIRDRFNT